MLAIGHTSIVSNKAQAVPSTDTSIRVIQNAAGATAIVIVTNKKSIKDSIVVTSSSLQRKSGPKTTIFGAVSVGKNGSSVVTSAIPLPEKSTISVFSGVNHLMTVVDIPISTAAAIPKSSKAVVLSKNTSKKILQAAAGRWRIELDKSVDQIITKVSVDQKALRDVVDSANAALKAYGVAGGDTKNQVVIALINSINARPQVMTEISNATNAVREATNRLPAPLDPVALREANDLALESLNTYLVAGGSTLDALFVALLDAMKVFPPVVADISAATNALRVATNQLPPLVDPRLAAMEEVLRGLVVKAEALIDSYFASGGSGEDDVAINLLRALNANPQNSSDIAEAMNALSFAKTQLPTSDNLEDVLGG